MAEWYNRSWNHIVSDLDTDIYRGLSQEKIGKKKEEFGDNVINIKPSENKLKIFLLQLIDPWLILMIVSIFICFYFKDFISGSILALITLATVISNTLEDYKYAASFKALENLNSTMTTVIRGGRVSAIKCTELVVGDLVILEKNFIVPADIRIVESEELKIVETIVTGEDYISEKYETKIEDRDIPLSEMKNIAFKGSKVVDGNGTGVVINVGVNTEIGKIVSSLMQHKDEERNLNRRIRKSINNTSIIFILIALLIVVPLYLKERNSLVYFLNISHIILVSFIPPLVFIALLGFNYYVNKKFRQENIHIKDMSVMERVNDLDVLIIDKIGAISEEEMIVEKIYTDSSYFEVGEKDITKYGNVERILHIGVLCNNAKATLDKKADLIDFSLISYAKEKGILKNELERNQRRIFEVPYDTDKRIATTLNKIEDKYRANVKGSLDMLLDRCTHIMKNDIEREITEEDINEIKKVDMDLSSLGLRTVGFAYRSFSYEPTPLENIESNLVFVGIIGFYNPLKEDIGQSISSMRVKGVNTIMITDDNKLAAYTIGKFIGIANSQDNVLSGIELKYMEEEELERNFEKIKIFSRVTAEQKDYIVKLYEDKGYNVLCTGENMTELPSMDKAKVGVALGKNGSLMLRRLADIYIEEDYYNNILKIVTRSGSVLNNIDRFLKYVLIIGLAESGFNIASLLFIGKYILDLKHLLLINLIMIILGAIRILKPYRFK